MTYSRTDKDRDRIVLNEDTSIQLHDSNGERMTLDHVSRMDGYVAFTNMNGQDVTVSFVEVEE